MMLLELFPFEKIPLFIWAGVLFAFGVFLFLDAEPLSAAQARAGICLFIGGFAVAYDLRRRSIRKRSTIITKESE